MEDASEYTFKIVLLGVIALVCILSFFILCASTQLLKILGETGNNVMMRLMGLILMVIAVECFISGIRPVLIEILKQAHKQYYFESIFRSIFHQCYSTGNRSRTA